MTPLEKWAKAGESVRFLEPGCDLDDLFVFEFQRKVQKDRTVCLNGVVYELDASLVGETVRLRFDPGAPPQRPVQVCHKNRFIELAHPVEPYANCFVKRNRPSRTLQADTPAQEPATPALKLRDLSDQHHQED